MQLFLLRHGIAAEPDSLRYPDDDRPLTDEGIDKMQRTARGMKTVVDSFDVILASPLLRTMQTAEIVAGEFDIQKCLFSRDELALGGSTKRIAAMLEEYSNAKRVLLVSHQPELVDLTAAFTGMRPEAIEMKKGSLTCLSVNELGARPRATLSWQYTSQQLRRMDP